MSIMETMLNVPHEHEANVFGAYDRYVKTLEKTLNVTLVARDGGIKMIGEEAQVGKARRVLEQLIQLSERGNEITEQQVNYALSLSFDDKEDALVEMDADLVCRTITGKPIKPKTIGQKAYVDQIREKMIVFGVGPAGTGKTYLAMAMAIQAFKNDEVSRIILTRPAIEAGEKLGFLPGDLQSKVDPYLRPLYDALHQIMGAESFLRNSEKGLIEVAPLAYMRGRTLDNAFIILDEAQNTTPAQMKMFLTRIGFGSKVVITGDQTQKDLPAGTSSGLDQALRVLARVEDIGFSYLTSQDVVRHPLVQKIVQAYDDFDARTAKKDRDQAQKRKEASRNFLARRAAGYAERTAAEEPVGQAGASQEDEQESGQNRAERRAQAARQERLARQNQSVFLEADAPGRIVERGRQERNARKPERNTGRPGRGAGKTEYRAGKRSSQAASRRNGAADRRKK